MKKELKIFDNPRTVKKFLIVFYVSLAVLLCVEPFVHKHAEFGWETSPGFFAAYGFISCVLLIFVARMLRIFLKRGEDYYD